jgi:multiple sugar transport system permease protein
MSTPTTPSPRTQAIRVILASAGALLVIAPLLMMLSTSLKDNVLVFELPPKLIPDDPTVSNYTEAWNSNDFSRYFANSVIVAVGTTLAVVVLSSMTAYAFARFDFPGRRLLFVFLLVGLMIPTMMLIIPQFVLAQGLGMTNSLTGLIVFYASGGIAFNTFLLRGFFEKVPRELDEAMVVDGAGPVRRYLSLYLPLARPALATSAIFGFLAAWDEFVLALTMVNDPDKRTLPIAIALFQGERQTSWGLVFAASVLAVLPVITVYVLGQRHYISGIAAGAVKA